MNQHRYLRRILPSHIRTHRCLLATHIVGCSDVTVKWLLSGSNESFFPLAFEDETPSSYCGKYQQQLGLRHNTVCGWFKPPRQSVTVLHLRVVRAVIGWWGPSLTITPSWKCLMAIVPHIDRQLHLQSFLMEKGSGHIVIRLSSKPGGFSRETSGLA